ncbi:calcium-binding protein [Haloterrigena salifodinae]|uniref:Calcium-binding protein n=2 Tax=Haloterrigena salifodinae TaxID=2675099 RepID=A0A8T8E524_9EURY|nr:calcium-binding protein [Haloterrigena salifodinae]
MEKSRTAGDRERIMAKRESIGDPRRSFMAKGVLAAGALTLGATPFGTATGSAQREQTAVFSNNYYPEAGFDVVSPLQTSATVEILQADGEPVPEISQPDEWTGYIIRYDIGDVREAGITTFLFTRGQRLSAGSRGTIGEDASVLSSQLNLLSTSVTEETETGPQPLEEDEIDAFEEAIRDDDDDPENGGE